MTYAYLLIAGILVSLTHVYIVWSYRVHAKRSISEYVVLSKRNQFLYFIVHVICEVLVLLYAHQFFLVEHHLFVPFYFLAAFAVLDFIQAVLPSKGKTEKIHFIAAYTSWVSYLVAGIVALLQLQFVEPFGILAAILFVPVVGLFLHMHIKRSKLYPAQLLMVPLYVVCMLLITIGASTNG